VRPGPLTAQTFLVDRNVRRGFFVSRADVADAILAALADPATIGHALGLGY
jgi:hypothetical protein